MEQVWIVRRNPENMQVEGSPYGVWDQDFRESSHYNKYEAEKRCYELNFMEDVGYWGMDDNSKLEVLACLDPLYAKYSED